MENYKIYKYTNKVNNKVYIGQTRQTMQRRAMGKGWGYKKCPHFFAAIKKYGWENFSLEILHENLNREEADILEKKYISYFKSAGLSYNIDKGGKSKGEHKLSFDIKQKISDAMKGKNSGDKNGMYGKSANNKNVYVFDNEHKLITIINSFKTCSQILNIKGYSLSNYLKKYTLKVGDKFYSKTSEIKLPIKIYKSANVGVSQYDLNGNLIKHYDKTIDVKRSGLVNDNLLRSHRDTPWIYNNYIWVFDDINTDVEILKCAAPTSYKYKHRTKNSQLSNTIIYKYDLMGNFIKKYNCFADAIKEVGVTYNSLKKLHYGPWIANNFIWADSGNIGKVELIVEAYSNIDKYTTKKPIFQFNMKGELLRAFISQKEIKKHYKLCRDTINKYICNGPFIYKGFIWSDLDNLYPINTIIYRSKNNICFT